MSEADNEAVTVSEGGVRVEKVVDTAKFDVPTLVYRIESSAGQSREVRLKESLPASVPSTNIGYHPNYYGNCWHVGGNSVEFVREFEPGESIITLIGVIDVDPESEEWLRSAPSLVTGSPSTETSDLADLLEQEGENDGTVIQFPNTTVPNETEAPTSGQTNGESRGSDPPKEVAEGMDRLAERIVELFATSLRSGSYREDDLKVIAKHVGGGNGSFQAKVQHLQREYSDLSAYIDSLEKFFDDQGTADVISSMSEDINMLIDQVGTIESELEENSRKLNSQDEQLSAILDDLNSIQSTIQAHRNEIEEQRHLVDTTQTELEDVKGATRMLNELDIRLDSVERTVKQIQDRVENVSTFQDRLTTTLSNS